MILQCDDRQLRAGLARRRATKVSNYLVEGKFLAIANEGFNDFSIIALLLIAS